SATQPIDLCDLLVSVAGLTAPRWRDTAQAEGRPIDLRLECPGPLTMQGWPASLREALTNLIFNAVDAMPAGGTIGLAARREADRLLLDLSDSGVGMSPELQARIFEPYFTTKGERGNGLGLAIVLGIVERHQGTIAIDSAPGRGTTVHLTFPAAQVGGQL